MYTGFGWGGGGGCVVRGTAGGAGMVAEGAEGQEEVVLGMGVVVVGVVVIGTEYVELAGAGL